MLKNLLRLLATSVTFIALAIFPNTALAASLVDNSLAETVKPPLLEEFSLNVISPYLKSTNELSKSPLNHWGCSCGACFQGVAKPNNNI